MSICNVSTKDGGSENVFLHKHLAQIFVMFFFCVSLQNIDLADLRTFS
jgi:hypothetical protein